MSESHRPNLKLGKKKSVGIYIWCSPFFASLKSLASTQTISTDVSATTEKGHGKMSFAVQGTDGNTWYVQVISSYIVSVP